ncbi:MAG: nitroreductase family protein [Candidatus Competibacteraceae bacterium]
MWDFFATVRHRHSVRKFQPDMPVEAEKLHAILEMACAAPSAGDIQAYRIFVVQNGTDRIALGHAAQEQSFLAEAPACLVFCADPPRSANVFGERGAQLYALQDATIAAAYAQLAVVAAGLGSIWIGQFDEVEVRRLLALEPELIPIALLGLGYPAELPEPSTRRRLEDIVSFR